MFVCVRAHVRVCVCIYGYVCIYTATTIIWFNPKFIRSLGSLLVYSKTGHTSEGSKYYKCFDYF